MKRRRSGWGAKVTGKKWRWGSLMVAAFAAGLLTVGVAVLLPGGGTRTGPGTPEKEDLPATIPPSGDRGPAGPAAPGTPPALLAIVVDGCGYDPTRDAEWLKFPEPITLAIIPFGPSSRRLAKSAHERGLGVLIHVPMEPEGSASDRTDGFQLRRRMSESEMGALLGRMMDENPWASGVSNHMGSAFTADPGSMASFAALLRSKKLFFLDRVTTPRSVAVRAARQAGIRATRRDVVLDADRNPDAMRRQWKQALSIARKKGTAILVCQGRKESLQTILDLAPDLETEGVRAVTLPELLEREPST